MKYVFGPVPSRRLGQSLGIDTIPLKTCNWNCVYCQLGRSKPLCNERKEYIPKETIISQVEDALASHRPGEIDWITFVGSGEPTLHSGIGWLIREVKAQTDLLVAVITNGSLLFEPDVREALLPVDALLPSLDAGTPKLYKKLNRPHPGVPYNRYVEGLINFRQEFKGKFWLEVMLVKDLNDTEEALTEIARKVELIQPDQVQIGLPTRPPAEEWVKLSDEEGIMRAIAILGEVAVVAPPIDGKFDLSGGNNVVDAILAIITRHPMSEEQLLSALVDFSEEERSKILDELEKTGQARKVRRFGRNFWSTKLSFFPDSD